MIKQLLHQQEIITNQLSTLNSGVDFDPIITTDCESSAGIYDEVIKIMKSSKNKEHFLELIKLKLTQFKKTNIIKDFQLNLETGVIILITSNSGFTSSLVFHNTRFQCEKMQVQLYASMFDKPSSVEMRNIFYTYYDN